MVLTIWTPSVLLAGASFLLSGAGPHHVGHQHRHAAPDRDAAHLLGRVSAINSPPTAPGPVGALIGALVGALYGAETCLLVAALGFLVQAVVIVASPVLRLARQPEMVG